MGWGGVGWGGVVWGGVGWGGVGWGGVGGVVWGGVGWGGYAEFIMFYETHYSMWINYYIYTEYVSLANYCVTFCLCLD